MNTHRPRFLQATVVSSGTRYIRECFQNAGLVIARSRHVSKFDRLAPDLVWGHFDRDKVNHAAAVCDKHFIILRDPIRTWASNYFDSELLMPNRPIKSVNKNVATKIQTLQTCWTEQNKFVHQWEPYVHILEKDSLDVLSGWAGVNLKAHEQTYATPNRMKDAVINKDVNEIERLTKNTPYWKWFVEEATPIFQDFYEQYNYDLWWKHG